jgi:hypothetical protein
MENTSGAAAAAAACNLSDPTSTDTMRQNRSMREFALRLLVAGVCAIALAYASAFLPPTFARAGASLMAVAVPSTMFAMMMLGAVRTDRGLGPLTVPFAVVFVLVAGGLSAALWMPPDAAGAPLWFGLPARAAVIIVGVGLVPLFMLPVVYALSFDRFTLSDADVARVRATKRAVAPETSPTSSSVGGR